MAEADRCLMSHQWLRKGPLTHRMRTPSLTSRLGQAVFSHGLLGLCVPQHVTTPIENDTNPASDDQDDRGNSIDLRCEARTHPREDQHGQGWVIAAKKERSNEVVETGQRSKTAGTEPAVLNATGSQRVGPLVRRRTPDRVRFATGRGFGRLIASHMTVFSGGAAVSSNSMPP